LLRTNLAFEVFLEMSADKIDRIAASPQAPHHRTSFKHADNQHGQFRRIDVRTNVTSSLTLLGNRMQAIEPPTEGLPSFRSQPGIAIVGIDGRIQQRASSGHQSSTPVPKVPDHLFQAINSIRDLLCAFESRIYRDLPSVVEGFCRKLLLAVKVPIDPAFFKPSCLHQIRQGSSVVTPLIEDRRGLANDFLPGLFTLAHFRTPATDWSLTPFYHKLDATDWSLVASKEALALI
jgi:hypothetical protein